MRAGIAAVPAGLDRTVTIAEATLITVPDPALLTPVRTAAARHGLDGLATALHANDILGPAELAYADAATFRSVPAAGSPVPPGSADTASRPGTAGSAIEESAWGRVVERVGLGDPGLRGLIDGSDPDEAGEADLDGATSAVAVVRDGRGWWPRRRTGNGRGGPPTCWC